MSSAPVDLTLVPALRPGEALPGGGGRTHREFLDFRVDGVSLGDAVRARAETPVMADLVSVLVTNWPGGFPAGEVRALLGQGPQVLSDGRVALYVCAECGELDCGAVTAVVERDGRDVVWRDLGWQTHRDPEVYLDPYRDLGPYHFETALYSRMLRGLLRAG